MGFSRGFIIDNYLPLSGGTLSGPLVFDEGQGVDSTPNNGGTEVFRLFEAGAYVTALTGRNNATTADWLFGRSPTVANNLPYRGLNNSAAAKNLLLLDDSNNMYVGVSDSNLWLNTFSIVTINAAAGALNARNSVDGDYFTIGARDSDTDAIAEVARVVGDTDPYIAFGGSQQFKIYNSGGTNFGNNLVFSASVDPTQTTDQVHIGGYDVAIGARCLAIGQEDAVVTEGSPLTHNRSLRVRVNGANYKLMMVAI